MSRLIAKILLTVFMIPFAALVYLISFSVIYNWNAARGKWYADPVIVLSGVIAWLTIATYWIFVWRSQVVWTTPRVTLTFLLAIVSAATSTVIAKLVRLVVQDDSTSNFIGTTLCPILWLIGTVLVWRESAEERAARITNAGGDALTCPVCGYNLTGLSEPRCPECGTKFTLSDLFARQPSRATIAQDREIAG